VSQQEALTATVLGAGQGQVSPRAYLLLERVGNAHHVVGLATADDAPAPEPERWEGFARALAGALNGLVIREGALLDPEGRALLAPDGSHDPAASLLVLPDALERKQRSQARLELLSLPVKTDLPPLPALEEVALRPAPTVARRSQALWAVAGRASGALSREQAVELLQQRGLWGAATPAEQAFLLDEEPSAAELEAWRPRTEALWTLLWALQKAPHLGPPTKRAELDACTDLLRRHEAAAFVRNTELRPTAEVLDEACVIFRCAWVVAAAEQQGQPVPKGLLPDVVRARHLALFWLIGHRNQAWDGLAGA